MTNPTKKQATRTDGNLTPAALEGMLAGQRRLIEVLLAIAVEAKGPGLLDDLERRLGIQDHEEDPGALPTAGFAIERLANGEIRRMLRSVRDACATGGERHSPSSVA